MKALFLALNLLVGTPAAILGQETVSEHVANQFFFYREGQGSEKRNFESNSFLTLNTCMMNGIAPALYGGMTASNAERAKKIGAFVANENPDIFLAQEVTLQSSQYLYEEMKDQYPHFWVGMGIEPGKKEADLFVASKYPIVGEPIFIPFGDELQRDYKYPHNLNDIYGKRLIDRGFFCLETPEFWIVTSHLEPGSVEEAASYRRDQLALITEHMDLLAESTGKPYIVCGDLNIARTPDNAVDEYLSSGIPDLYYDYYTEHHPEFNEETFTCTNLFTHRTNGIPEPTLESDRNEIDDYVLIRKPYKNHFKDLRVELLSTYDVNQDASEALTDHRAYKASFHF